MNKSQLPAATLQEQIATDLRAQGHSTVTIDDFLVTVDMWRKIARAAARSLGRPVQTLLVGKRDVTAVLRDWPATPEERAIQDASLRAAMNRLPPVVVPQKSGRKTRQKIAQRSVED